MEVNESTVKILRDNMVDAEDQVWHTHVSMVQPRGKFKFNREQLERFWANYCVELINKQEFIFGIAEKPNRYLPVLVDVDLKIIETDDFSINSENHLYSSNQLKQVVTIYQKILKDILETYDEKDLDCVVLEKPIYYITTGESRYIKNGFHLHFPNIFLSKEDQSVHLNSRVRLEMTKQKVFSSLGIEDSSSVIDGSVCNVPWLLYGSRKSEDSNPYLLTKIYNHSLDVISLSDAFKDYEIFNDNEEPIKIKDNIQYYLPRILSIIPYGRHINNLKDGLELINTNSINNSRKNVSKRVYNQTSVSSEQNLKVATELIEMVGYHRADDRNEWMNIGWILYNIGDSTEEAFNLWLDFSRRSEKFDELACVYQWERMTKKDKTIGSLKYLAKLDSPDRYDEFVQKQIDPLLKSSLNGSHNDVANVLWAYFGDEYRCASITSKCWYQFRSDEHKWEEIEEGVFLREQISKKLVKDYVKMASSLMEDFGNEMDQAKQASLKVKLSQINKIICNMKSAPFKNNVMREASEVFYDRKFKNKLDQNPFLIAFKNGVYDLKANLFRPGSQDDYISKTIPINYREFTHADTAVSDVKSFLEKIFPDSSIRNYFMDVYSDIFVGGNTQKKVYMWTGDGDNGKSIAQNFFEMMLGELAIKFNTQYFTGKKTSTGSANPELSRAAPPIRHVTMEEPDADEQLNIGELKKLSGGDSYWARDLFEKGSNTREVFPMFTLTFICNKLPKLKYSDQATWNRIRVIPFESTFVDSSEICPTTYDEQLRQKRFPMDRDFKCKIPDMIEAFAWYLLQWRSKITVRTEPEKVKEATAIYRRQNDIYRQFIEECIMENNHSSISLTEMYAHFKEWFKESFPNISLPIKNEVKEYFERLWGDSELGCRWTGYRIRTLQDDIDNGDAILLDDDDLIDYNGSTSNVI